MAFLDLVYYGNSVQTWLIALALSLVVFLGLELAKNLVFRQLAALAQKTDKDWDDQLVKLLARTRSWFLLVLSIYAGSQVLSLSAAARGLLEKVTVLVLLIQVAIWGNNLINYLIGRYLRITREKDSESKATVSILGLVARIGLYTIIVLLLLDNLGFEISTLIAGLGIGGIAIALAAQNILSDLFGSLTILLDKPFVVGDFILVDNFYGTVEHIGLKSTRIRSLAGEQLVFSNHDLLNSRIQNYQRMQERRVVFRLRINYQTPYEKLAAIPSLLKEIVEAQGSKIRFDRAHFKSYEPSSLDFEIVYYVLSDDYYLYMDLQQQINLAIFRRFAEEGIEFAYPTQTLYLNSICHSEQSEEA